MKLELKNLSLSYQKNRIFAVKELNYTFTEGVYGLLGPNGAGKTTLMNLIVGNLTPGEGEILCDGKDIRAMGKDYRNLIGYMPQMQSLYDDFTGERFLWYMAGLKGLNHREAKTRIGELLGVVNLQKDRYKKIRNYSGGMKQRLLIAQALLNDPKILILDEPTAGLDPKERIRIRNFISTISESRIVLLATHIVSDVEAIAKEMLFMKEGKLILTGTPAETVSGVQGKVWEVLVTAENGPEFDMEKCIVSNMNRTAEGILYRIVSEEKPCETAQTVRPTTEDLYLYLMNQ